ncbi:MAG: TlpA disulfide reductase family protein, partial [Planctomycetota bacterium]
MHTLPALVLACAIVSPVVADELTVGDPAPALTVGQWLKGEPVDAFENGHVYVVEFWATWCGPCIAGMPHLSEVQKEYGDRVTVIGVNIWEREPEKVPAWMEEQGNALMQ